MRIPLQYCAVCFDRIASVARFIRVLITLLNAEIVLQNLCDLTLIHSAMGALRFLDLELFTQEDNSPRII